MSQKKWLGENASEVPKELISFLKFVKADLSESKADFKDDFVKRLQDSIQHIKSNREMEERFMIFEEMLREERTEGRSEGQVAERIQCILSLLEMKGAIPEYLCVRIREEKDLSTLKQWFLLSANVDSIDEFIKKANLF